ncbi:MAG: RNA 2',3'-cyclic phosphodiesterase [Desulfonatronovibrionaceae bacterium]
MRLFVALGLPPEYKDGLRAIKERWEASFASGLKWTRPENWHLTLKFIGEQDPADLDRIKQALDSVSFSRLFLQASGGGFFSGRGRIKVAWAGMSGEVQGLKTLASEVDKALTGVGIPAEKRPFQPHLTLFRVKRFRREDPWKEFGDYLKGRKWPEFACQKICLWQSTLTRRGPVYEQMYWVPCLEDQGIRTDNPRG